MLERRMKECNLVMAPKRACALLGKEGDSLGSGAERRFEEPGPRIGREACRTAAVQMSSG